LYNKWTYKTDNEFAIDILSGLPATYQYPPTSLIRCCKKCSNLLFGGQPRTIHTLSTIIGGCNICKYLHDIRADWNTHEWGKSRVERKDSALVLNGKRVLVLRSNLGKLITFFYG
jgi:hypothetical protein